MAPEPNEVGDPCTEHPRGTHPESAHALDRVRSRHGVHCSESRSPQDHLPERRSGAKPFQHLGGRHDVDLDLDVRQQLSAHEDQLLDIGFRDAVPAYGGPPENVDDLAGDLPRDDRLENPGADCLEDASGRAVGDDQP
jgi:hypothetical protein